MFALPIKDAQMDSIPGPQPKSPMEQSIISSNEKAAVYIIRLAISADVETCSNCTMHKSVLKNALKRKYSSFTYPLGLQKNQLH